MERYREAAEPSLAVLGGASIQILAMDAVALTRALVDIDSVTPNEEQVGVYLATYLEALAGRTAGRVERYRRKYEKASKK